MRLEGAAVVSEAGSAKPKAFVEARPDVPLLCECGSPVDAIAPSIQQNAASISGIEVGELYDVRHGSQSRGTQDPNLIPCCATAL